MRSPIPLKLVLTSESESFRDMPPGVTGLPVAPHPGAFAVVRKNHVHEGVDLYCPDGTPVFAMTAGLVVGRFPFTGPAAGLPWWLDTDVVLVEDDEQVWAYGEIKPCVEVGQRVEAGALLGHVTRVLRNDKGRPMSMLHLERHILGTRECLPWDRLPERPTSLLDPTECLMRLV